MISMGLGGGCSSLMTGVLLEQAGINAPYLAGGGWRAPAGPAAPVLSSHPFSPLRHRKTRAKLLRDLDVKVTVCGDL